MEISAALWAVRLGKDFTFFLVNGNPDGLELLIFLCRYPRHKKYLTKIVNEISDLRFSNNKQ